MAEIPKYNQVTDTRQLVRGILGPTLLNPEFSPQGQLNLEDSGWITPESILPAPFLVTGLAKLHEKSPELTEPAVFSIGLPVVTAPKTENEMKALFKEKASDDELAFYIGEWVDKHVLQHIQGYSPEGGFAATRAVALEEFGAQNDFSIPQTTLISGGRQTALDNIYAALTGMTSEGQAVQTIDITNRSIIDAITEIEAAHDKGDYIELIVADSAKLPEEERRAIKRLANIGAVMIVDIVSEPLDERPSLGKDSEIKNLVLTLEDTRQAKMTGVHLIVGNQTTVKAVQDSFTALEGTPATTQQDFRGAMHDIYTNPIFSFLKERLLTLTDKEIDAMQQSDDQPFLKDMVTLFRNATRYYKGDDKALEAHHKSLKDKVLKLEKRAEELNGNLYPGRKAFVANGAARGGLSTQYKALADLGTTHLIIPEPAWPYRDLERSGKLTFSGNSLEFQYMKDIFYVENPEKIHEEKIIRIGFDKTRLEQRLTELQDAGERVAIQLFSGPQNPTTYVLSTEQKKYFVELAKKNNSFVLSDDTYIHEAFSPEDENTFAQAANNLEATNDISTTTFTKDDSHAGARIAILWLGDADLYEKLAKYRDMNSINAVSVLLESGLMVDPKAQDERRTATMQEAKHRTTLEMEQADNDGVPHNTPGGAHYGLELLAGFADGIDPLADAVEHAAYGVGVLPVKGVLGGTSNDWDGICRVASAGPDATDDSWRQRYAYMHDITAKIAKAKKKAT